MTTPAAHRPTALVVDDATTVRMYHRSLIEAAGWTVIEAENGMEALERALDRTIDLMLIDVNMPVMDGYRFLDAARTMPHTRDVPAVMISTEAQVHDAEQAFAAGANHYLVKPVKPNILSTLLSFFPGEERA